MGRRELTEDEKAAIQVERATSKLTGDGRVYRRDLGTGISSTTRRVWTGITFDGFRPSLDRDSMVGRINKHVAGTTWDTIDVELDKVMLRILNDKHGEGLDDALWTALIWPMALLGVPEDAYEFVIDRARRSLRP